MSDHPADLIAAANGSMTDHPLESAPPEAADKESAHVDLHLSFEEAEALLMALDALHPLRERLRAEVAPEPEPEPMAIEPVVSVVDEDHLTRATRLARESLQEARFALGERGPSAEQRRAWQDAARRYVDVTKRSVRGGRR